MSKKYLFISIPVLFLLSGCNSGSAFKTDLVYNVLDFGAKGDGVSLDTESINQAIDRCSKSGGGTIFFPEGTSITGSIHLANNITLEITKDARILGAANDINAYDLPEDNPWSYYQDFRHSHFRNALIWGENLETIQHRPTLSKGVCPQGIGNQAVFGILLQAYQ